LTEVLLSFLEILLDRSTVGPQVVDSYGRLPLAFPISRLIRKLKNALLTLKIGQADQPDPQLTKNQQ